MIPVRVKFCGIAHLPDAAEHVIEPRMQARFTACDCNAVQESLTLPEKSQQLLLAHDRRGLPRDKFKVVAVGTPEVALSEKDRAGNLPRKVEKGHFLKSVYFHHKYPAAHIHVP